MGYIELSGYKELEHLDFSDEHLPLALVMGNRYMRLKIETEHLSCQLHNEIAKEFQIEKICFQYGPNIFQHNHFILMGNPAEK